MEELCNGRLGDSLSELCRLQEVEEEEGSWVGDESGILRSLPVGEVGEIGVECFVCKITVVGVAQMGEKERGQPCDLPILSQICSQSNVI